MSFHQLRHRLLSLSAGVSMLIGFASVSGWRTLHSFQNGRDKAVSWVLSFPRDLRDTVTKDEIRLSRKQRQQYDGTLPFLAKLSVAAISRNPLAFLKRQALSVPKELRISAAE